MKTLLHPRYRKYYFLVCCIVLVASTSSVLIEKSAGFAEKNHFLHMEGKLKNALDQSPSKTVIEILYLETSLRYQVLQSDSTTGACAFKLPLQSNFLVKFMKPGHITKKITVNTHLPEKLVANYLCEFDYEMFPQVQEIKAEQLLKEPIADFFFNEKSGNFYYDQAATEIINSKVRSMYTEYFAAHAKPDEQPMTKSDRRIPVVLK